MQAEDDRLVEAGMLVDGVEPAKPAFTTVGHATDEQKEMVTTGKESALMQPLCCHPKLKTGAGELAIHRCAVKFSS